MPAASHGYRNIIMHKTFDSGVAHVPLL